MKGFSRLEQALHEYHGEASKRQSETDHLFLEVCEILGVPGAPAGTNAMFRQEDILRTAREVASRPSGAWVAVLGQAYEGDYEHVGPFATEEAAQAFVKRVQPRRPRSEYAARWDAVKLTEATDR